MTITQFVNTFRIVSFECPQFCYLRKRKVYKYKYFMCSWCGWENPSQRRSAAYFISFYSMGLEQ